MSHLIWPWRFIDLEATFIDLDSVWSSIWHNLKFVILLMLCVLRIWLADSSEIETFKVQINDIRWLFHFFFYRYYLKVDLWLNYGNTSVTLEDRGTSRSIPESSVSNRNLRSWELTWGIRSVLDWIHESKHMTISEKCVKSIFSIKYDSFL